MVKVMVVDDNEDIRFTLSTILQKEGHEITSAENGEDFLNKVEEAKPVLVLLDVMMPGLTTSQIIDGLREKHLEKLKIILVTVVRFSEAEKKALQKGSGIVDYVPKPFDVTHLVEVINKHI